MDGPSELVRQDWAASGLAHLTGPASGLPDFSRAGVLAHARATADDLGRRLGISVDAAELLAGRAALLGLTRRGRVSAGGASRLIATCDGWCAVTLARPDDVDAVPALVEHDVPAVDPWAQVAHWAAGRPTADVVERARLLDLPAAALGETVAAGPVTRRTGPAAPPRVPSELLVVDLSSMWAGPLCGHLLQRAGATVVKVESTARPDGTRAGSPAFFDWMNAGKLSYAADFDDTRRLAELLGAADVVIESSRPTALHHRGLGAADVAARDGRIWVRITGHGADAERANWPAFGDDAAVAGGLVGRSADGPVFCGDAIADPLTGIQAALSVAESLSRGGGEVVDVAMAAVAAEYASFALDPSGAGSMVLSPKPPVLQHHGAALGADCVAVERLLVERRLAPC